MLNPRHTLRGRLRFENLGRGNWRVTNLVEPHERLFLHELDLKSVLGSSGLGVDECSELSISWSPDGAIHIVLRGQGDPLELRAANAFVHEPRERLYEGLKLPGYGAPARRFWSRVFMLVRIPGGRLLLGWIARRSR